MNSYGRWLVGDPFLHLMPIFNQKENIMNRLTVGIILSFAVILSVTALNYTPDPLSSTSNCQYKSACGQSGQACGKVDSCGKKTFNKRCGKTVCANNKQNCSISSNCTKSCSAQKAKACGPDCTKPCCAEKKGIWFSCYQPPKFFKIIS